MTNQSVIHTLRLALAASAKADQRIHVALVAVIEEAIDAEDTAPLNDAAAALQSLKFAAQRNAAIMFIATATGCTFTGKTFDGVPEWNEHIDLDAGKVTINGADVYWWDAKDTTNKSKPRKYDAKAEAIKCAERMINKSDNAHDALMARVIAMTSQMTNAQLQAILAGEAQSNPANLPKPQLKAVATKAA